MKIVRSFVLIAFLGLSHLVASADEGMWLPQLLQALNEKDMKRLGMKMSAQDIYSINKSSLKDAIVSFGGGCTAEVISEKGLILTNHHCGFGQIQNHSTLASNYIKEGFWAKNHKEELKNPGLTATFIISITDVTTAVLSGVGDKMMEKERQALIAKNIEQVRKSAKKESYQESFVRAFFEGNKYYLFITEVYKDVRLVGAPPAAIGNFGKDTDNWVWPRHTGDFSLFRIYADKNNRPAEYSEENVPYKPKRALNISLDGVDENDFTMVFGFPGRTMEYLHSAAVAQVMNVNDPAKIAIRGNALQVLNKYMRGDELIKIQYAAKYAGIENAYKKWQGEVQGLRKKNAVDKKKMYEADFAKRVNGNPEWKAKYGTLLEELEAAYAELEPLGYGRDMYMETMARIELFSVAGQMNSLVNALENNGGTGFGQAAPKVHGSVSDILHEYNVEVDKELFASLIAHYMKHQKKEFIAPYLAQLASQYQEDYHKLADYVYQSSMMDDSAKVMNVFSMVPIELATAIKNDLAVTIWNEMQKYYNQQVGSKIGDVQNRVNALQRTYMQAQLEVFKEKRFYPDANSTLRVTYGKAKGSEPRDGIKYAMYTYLDGVMEKYVPGDYEFDVPAKLIELYNKKDYGRYGVKGKQPVCFIATNHTTGGNSGSPALDAHGNLIGLNFDRAWEGTMSDIFYDADICRNIMVDIRYVTFIIDKFANAQNIISELKFVHPKKGAVKPAAPAKKVAVKQ